MLGLLAPLLAAVPASAGSTPTTVPTPDLVWVPGDGSVEVSWAHPVPGRQLAAVVLWRVEGKTSGWDGLTSRFDLPADGSVTSYTITGLDNGTTYETWMIVYDQPAVEFNDAKPATLLVTPGAPHALSVSAGPLNLEVDLDVRWDDPEDNGDSATGYDVRFKRSDAEPWPSDTATCAILGRTCGSGSVSAISLDEGVIFPHGHPRRAWIGGLEAGVQYDVQVRAKNSRGTGPWSSIATGTPVGPPAQRTSVDDTTVDFGFATYSGTEGETITIELTLSAAHPEPVRFQVRPDFFESEADYWSDYSLGECPQLDPNDETITDEERAEAANCDFGVGLLDVEIPAGESSFSYDIRTEDDLEVEGDESFTLNISLMSWNAQLGAVPSTEITIVDNDAAGVVLTVPDVVVDGVSQAADKVHTTEGSSGTYTIVLTSQPEGYVRVYPESGMACKVRTHFPANTQFRGFVEFTPRNWDVPQTVYARAVLDYDAADEEIVITHRAEPSGSPSYEGVTVDSVTVAVADKHLAGVMVVTDLDPEVVEATDLELSVGATATNIVYPATDPSPIYGEDPADCYDYDQTRTVTVTAASSDPAVATVSPASVTFGPEVDYTSRSFTVTAVGSGTATITYAVSGSDPDYTDGSVSDYTFEVMVLAPPQGNQGPPSSPQEENPVGVVFRPDPVVPGPVLDVELSATGNSLTVSWQAPDTGTSPAGYVVHVKPMDGSKGKIKRPNAKKTEVTFANLEPGQTYRISVRAKNSHGKGPRTYTIITLPHPSP